MLKNIKLSFSDWLGIGLFVAGFMLTRSPKKQLPIARQPLPGVRTPKEEELNLLPGDEGLVPKIEKKYGDYARDAQKIYPNVPAAEILRFIHLESRGLKDAYDETNDTYGLMQLTPMAQQQYSVIDPFDPGDNIDGGAHMLSDLHRAYRDHPAYVAAAFYEWPRDLTPFQRKGSFPVDPDTLAYVKRALNLQRLYGGTKT